VISHELIMGSATWGRKFDAGSKLNDCWTAKTRET
jgi:predicted metalloendopeptidase